jgi:hypothetical protein
MEKKQYRRLIGIVSLLLAAFTLASAITSVTLYYVNTEEMLKIVFLPLLIVSAAITLISGIISTINLASVYGKVSFLLDIVSVALLIAAFVKLAV